MRVFLCAGALFSAGFSGLPCFAESIPELFGSAVIIGASVSADVGAPSPGKLVVNRARQKTRLLVRSERGVTSEKHEAWIEENLPKERPDIVIGVDLFFHDVRNLLVLNERTESRIRRIVDTLCRNAGQVYLGNTLATGIAFAPDATNALLSELAVQYGNLHIVDVKRIYEELYWDIAGYDYDLNGVQCTFSRKDVLADAIHPNLRGSAVAANYLIQAIHAANPEIEEDLPYLPMTCSGPYLLLPISLEKHR